jgi:hypothetical protein
MLTLSAFHALMATPTLATLPRHQAGASEALQLTLNNGNNHEECAHPGNAGLMGRVVLHTGSPVQVRLLFTHRSLQRLKQKQGRAGRCLHTVCSGSSSSSKDEVLRSISENGEVSLMVVTGTALVQEACSRHRTAPTASAALGRHAPALHACMHMCTRWWFPTSWRVCASQQGSAGNAAHGLLQGGGGGHASYL